MLEFALENTHARRGSRAWPRVQDAPQKLEQYARRHDVGIQKLGLPRDREFECRRPRLGVRALPLFVDGKAAKDILQAAEERSPMGKKVAVDLLLEVQKPLMRGRHALVLCRQGVHEGRL